MNTSLEDIISYINNYSNYTLNLNNKELLSKNNIIKISNAINNNNTIYKLIIDGRFFCINVKYFENNWRLYNNLYIDNFNILFDILKNNNTINTIKITLPYLSYNDLIKLSELLQVNTSITHFNLCILNEIIDEHKIILLADAFKNHNNLINLTLKLKFKKNMNVYKILESLQEQEYIEKLQLIFYNYSYTKEDVKLLLNIIDNLYYIKRFICKHSIFNDVEYNLNSIIKKLYNKKYLEYIDFSNCKSYDLSNLNKFIESNKQLEYLNISDLYNKSEMLLLDNNLINTINKSNLYNFNYNFQTNKLYYNTLSQLIYKSNLNEIYIQIHNDNSIYTFIDKIISNNNLSVIKLFFKTHNKNIINKIFDLIKNNNILQIFLMDININECITLFNMLENNESVYELRLNTNIDEYTDEFINSLCDLIKNNKELNKIIILDNTKFINLNHSNKILEALNNNTSLISLQLGGYKNY